MYYRMDYGCQFLWYETEKPPQIHEVNCLEGCNVKIQQHSNNIAGPPVNLNRHVDGCL